MRRLTALGIAILLAVGAVAAITAIAASKGSSTGTVNLRSTTLGKILVDSKSHTLYIFAKDKRARSACSGACAKNWPPLLTGAKPTAGGGARAAMLGTTRRSDGTKQVTYGGHPLYTFVVDAGKAGSTKGENVKAFGAEWNVLGADGKKIEKASGPGHRSRPKPAAPAPYGY